MKNLKCQASNLRKTIDKLQTSLGGVSGLKSKPEAVFVVDVVRDKIVVKEANKLSIPVIGLIDSNSDPSNIDYPIPANDDAMKSLKYLLGRIGEVLKNPVKTKNNG